MATSQAITAAGAAAAASKAVAYLAAAALLVAATCKLVTLWPPMMWGTRDWQVAVLIAAELPLAAVLLLHPINRSVRIIAAVVFAAFAAYNAHSAVFGHNTCRCFGHAVVMSTWMALADAVLCVAVFPWATHRRQLSIGQWKRVAWTALAAFAALSCAIVIIDLSGHRGAVFGSPIAIADRGEQGIFVSNRSRGVLAISRGRNACGARWQMPYEQQIAPGQTVNLMVAVSEPGQHHLSLITRQVSPITESFFTITRKGDGQ